MKLLVPGKHLQACLRMVAINGRSGLCIHRSVAFVLDTPQSDLVFGTFRAATPEERLIVPGASTTPFIHCWAEWRGAVVAPTLYEKLGLFPQSRNMYYELNGARDTKRLSRPQVLQLSGEYGLSAHLRYDSPIRGGKSFGTVLLEAAGVEWQDSGDGSIIPKGEEE
jgi:hypothetical protein